MIKILLVDDNRIMVRSLLTAVPWKDNGVEVAGIAHNGQEARALLNDELDVLVTDVRMPVMDGIELTRYVMKHYPYLRVVFISAYTEFEYAIMALQLNVFDYIVKPIDNKKLMEIVLRAGKAGKEERSQHSLLKKAFPAIRENFLRSLIQGAVFQEELMNLLGWTQQDWITLFVFGTDTGGEMRAITLWNLQQALDEAADVELYTLRDTEWLVAVFRDEVKPDKSRGDLYLNLIKNIIDQQKRKGMPIITSMSQTLQGYLSLHRMYLQARQILNIERKNAYDVLVSPNLLHLDAEIMDRAAKILSCAEGLLNLGTAEFEKRLLLLRSLLDKLERLKDFRAMVCCVMGICISDIMMENPRISMTESQEIYAAIFQDRREDVTEKLLLFLQNVRRQSIRLMNMESRNIIEKIYESIEKNAFSGENGLNQIASEVFLNPCYVSMLFKQETGKSITQYLRELRLDRAKQLLQDKSLKIYDIGQQIGYNNQYYFSVWFKKYTGMTPSEYREAFRE